MYHHVARALDGTALFEDSVEANHLFWLIANELPELDMLSLMPNHYHVTLPHPDEEGRLANVRSAWARARNQRRRERGSVWAPAPPPERVPPERIQGVRRYIGLNACRANLVEDPLAWLWCTHRDRVGLTADRVGPLEKDPDAWHRRVSTDEKISVTGTPLPVFVARTVSWEDLVDAVMSLCRCGADALVRRGRPRTLLIQAAWMFGLRDPRFLRDETNMSVCRIFQIVKDLPALGVPVADRDLEVVLRVAGDPRFKLLPPLDRLPGWKWKRR